MFNEHCLINDIYIPKKLINIFNCYTLNPWLRNLNVEFQLNNCLFRSAKLNKNADLDKYKYGGYGIGFDCCSEFSFIDRSMGKIIFFGGDMNSSVHILGEGPTQGLDDIWNTHLVR